MARCRQQRDSTREEIDLVVIKHSHSRSRANSSFSRRAHYSSLSSSSSSSSPFPTLVFTLLVLSTILSCCVAVDVSTIASLSSSSSPSTSRPPLLQAVKPIESSKDASNTDDQVKHLLTQTSDLSVALDSGWIFFTCFLVFFMQAGFSLLEAGAVGSKDIISILLKNFTNFAIATVSYWLIGSGFRNGPTPFIGVSNDGWFSVDDPTRMATQLQETMVCCLSVSIVSGAIACRFSFHAYMVLAFFFSAIIFPISSSWVWGHGFLSAANGLGSIDLSGSGVIHLQGGIVAIVACMFVGPRLGRFVTDPTTGKRVPATDFTGHSIVLTALGTLILFFGWFGLNTSASNGLSGTKYLVAGIASLNTLMAGSTGLLTGLLLTKLNDKSYNFWDVLNSTLAGLVAITSCSAVIGPGPALGVGGLGAMTYYFTNKFVLSMGIDDVVGIFSVHGTPGMIGLVCAGLFARQDYLDLAYGPGVITHRPGRQLGIQLLQLVAIVAWAVCTSSLVLWTLTKTVGIRVTAEDEIVGLDFKYHSGYAYETHNKRMLRAKKQIEREQILGEKMRRAMAATAQKQKSGEKSGKSSLSNAPITAAVAVGGATSTPSEHRAQSDGLGKNVAIAIHSPPMQASPSPGVVVDGTSPSPSNVQSKKHPSYSRPSRRDLSRRFHDSCEIDLDVDEDHYHHHDHHLKASRSVSVSVSVSPSISSSDVFVDERGHSRNISSNSFIADDEMSVEESSRTCNYRTERRTSPQSRPHVSTVPTMVELVTIHNDVANQQPSASPPAEIAASSASSPSPSPLSSSSPSPLPSLSNASIQRHSEPGPNESRHTAESDAIASTPAIIHTSPVTTPIIHTEPKSSALPALSSSSSSALPASISASVPVESLPAPSPSPSPVPSSSSLLTAAAVASNQSVTASPPTTAATTDSVPAAVATTVASSSNTVAAAPSTYSSVVTPNAMFQFRFNMKNLTNPPQ